MWFSVSVLSVAEHDDKRPSDALWEEQIFLVDAQHKEEALLKGEEFAKAGRPRYKNADGEVICWKFERVESIHELLEQEVKSGTEVFSRFLRHGQVESLLKDAF